MQEMPSIASSAYGSSTSTYNNLTQMAASSGNNQMFAGTVNWDPNREADLEHLKVVKEAERMLRQQTPRKQEILMADKLKRRLVQVFIADPNDNVPLDQSVIYTGEQKLTDSTDQELFFEVDIRGILEKHNEKRVKLVDKKVKERTEHLEPARVRDLKMVVVTIAEF